MELKLTTGGRYNVSEEQCSFNFQHDSKKAMGVIGIYAVKVKLTVVTPSKPFNATKLF